MIGGGTPWCGQVHCVHVKSLLLLAWGEQCTAPLAACSLSRMYLRLASAVLHVHALLLLLLPMIFL
jgi:hypothetical protein